MADVNSVLEGLFSDKSIPKNIKNSIEEAMNQLGSNRPEEKVHVIVSILDEISADINISPTARTEIWSVLSQLERLSSKH